MVQPGHALLHVQRQGECGLSGDELPHGDLLEAARVAGLPRSIDQQFAASPNFSGIGPARAGVDQGIRA